jgi:hypothetical protein
MMFPPLLENVDMRSAYILDPLLVRTRSPQRKITAPMKATTIEPMLSPVTPGRPK